jgi:hypothetical protein
MDLMKKQTEQILRESNNDGLAMESKNLNN